LSWQSPATFRSQLSKPSLRQNTSRLNDHVRQQNKQSHLIHVQVQHYQFKLYTIKHMLTYD